MDGNSWRPAPGEPAAVSDGSAADWRSQLQPEARQRIVNKIMETLKRHLPISVPEGLNELQKIAIRFEEKIYSAAANQSDYLRKISLKMLSMENKSQHSTSINPSISNSSLTNQNPADPASLGIQSQVSNPLNQSSARQQLLSQNMQNNTSVTAPNSANLPSALSSFTGLNQSTISSVSQTSNLQNMPSMSQNSANNSLGQTAVPDIYANAQRQMQGRQQQQQILSQQQHQSQNQFLYQHQLQQQLLKQKLQHSSLLQPHVQQQQQQQQSSQQPLMQMASNLQSGQSTIQQMQPGAIQSAVQPGLQQNQLSSVQQSVTSLLQQHPQSVARQQQQPHPTVLQQTPSLQQQQQQPTSAPQQSNLPMQQHQQQFMGQQANISNVQQTQLLGQQTSVTEMQQQPQRMPIQQNNLLSIQQPQHLLNQQNISLHQQQQLATQSNISGLQQSQQQQQQQQLLGSLPNASNMQSHQRPMHMLQQSKAAVQQQQQNQQAPLAMLQAQGQQLQHQSSQQQLISQFQSQPAQLQQQLVQQHPSSLQREMQQRMQASGALLSQNAIEQQKQFVQSQIGLPEVSSSTSLDSTAQTGHVGGVDLQEEIYQKIKSMKERYFPELSELSQKIALKLQQHEGLMSSVKASEQFDKMKTYKGMLDRILQFLQSPKSSMQPSMKDKLPIYEKQIRNLLAAQKKIVIPSQPPGQQQFQHPGGHSQSMPQQPPSQIPQLQQHDNYTNQQMNLQGSTTSVQPPAVASMQQGSVPLATHFGVPTPQQNITNALQTGSSIDTVQGSSFSSLQQGAIASMQQGGLVSGQSTISLPQPTNSNAMSHGSMNSLQTNVNSKQPSSSTMQQQHFKQEQQQQQQHLMQSQQIKQQLQQRHMQQQLMQQQQKQQLLQAQQPLQQQLQQQQQQQTPQMPVHQMPQLHQTNEVNELKLRQGAGIKPGLYQQHYSTGQRHSYYQQLKSGAAFPISSPQNFQASSPQISHHSSSQIEQHSLLSSQIKSGTPLQSASSPFAPSPSTPIAAPSPIPGESEKQLSGITSLTNASHIGHQQTAVAPPQAQSIAVATPGISASPLLAEFTSPDGNQTNLPNLVVGKASTAQRPLERLIEVIQSSTPKALSSAVSDIGSVVSMIDRIAGSAPGNGSRAAVGEDLVAMTKCRLQARSFMSQDGSATTKKMKRNTSAMPLNNVSSAGSLNDSFKQSYGLDTSELESTATSRVKQQKVEVNYALLEEIREINQRLIDTVVKISEEDTDSISAALEGEGTVVKCFFTAVALCPSLKSQFASEHMSPILPLRLLVPASYPKCSPVLLDKLPDEQSRESDDLSVKARSGFIISLRGLSQPMSLAEMARTWDACARKVITEFAQQTGGGTFSSRYGAWENCVGA